MNKIDHNYLPDQFSDVEDIIASIRAVVKRGDFTLGAEVALFEREFAAMCGVKHAIGVGNGTDALYLALKALGVKNEGDEVITTPYSFYATTASIKNAGGKPVFVDVGRDFNIDPALIEAAITPRTVGIACVHWAGRPCDMAQIMSIAERYKLWVLEDCAHAPLSLYHGKRCGSFGNVNTFSLHPLKNVNVWGDGGVITTDDAEKADWLRKARNHGMVDRNTAEFWGYNSRLDTVQAVVARKVLAGLDETTKQKRENASYLSIALSGIPGIELIPNQKDVYPNFYLYSFHAESRDELQAYLISHGIDAKVHYPTPLHLQPAAKSIKDFKRGDFPIAEWCADSTISLPVHEFITSDQLAYMARFVRKFYQVNAFRGGALRGNYA